MTKAGVVDADPKAPGLRTEAAAAVTCAEPGTEATIVPTADDGAGSRRR